MSHSMLIGILCCVIIFIILSITKLKLHAFLVLSFASIITALLTKIPLDSLSNIIQKGVGGTLGFLAIIIGCGAILGKMLELSGGARKIANSLLSVFGAKYADIAMMFIGFIAGIPVFVEVGFVLLVPLVFVVAKYMQISKIKIGITLATSLMCVHCLVPPHPAATSVVSILNADIAKVIAYSLIVGIVCAFFGSIVYLRFFTFKKDADSVITLEDQTNLDSTYQPSLFTALFCILLPLGLMLSKIIFSHPIITLISNPIIALLISVFVAYYCLGIRLGYSMQNLLDTSTHSFSQIASILLIIGAGGAFNEVLLESGIADALKSTLSVFNLNPIFLAWLIALILHISVGSATVAMISAAGIVQGLDLEISKEVLVLAIGSGAIGCTIITDSLFWLVKESLGLSMQEMFKYFSITTSIASLVGLLLSFILSQFI